MFSHSVEALHQGDDIFRQFIGGRVIDGTQRSPHSFVGRRRLNGDIAGCLFPTLSILGCSV